MKEKSELRIGLIVTITGVILTAVLGVIGWWAVWVSTTLYNVHGTLSSVETKQDYMLDLLAGRDVIPLTQSLSTTSN